MSENTMSATIKALMIIVVSAPLWGYILHELIKHYYNNRVIKVPEEKNMEDPHFPIPAEEAVEKEISLHRYRIIVNYYRNCAYLAKEGMNTGQFAEWLSEWAETEYPNEAEYTEEEIATVFPKISRDPWSKYERS